MMFDKADRSLTMSSHLNQSIHGIEIKKMPIRTYIQFASKGGALIPVIFDKLFPNMSTPQLITQVMTMDREGLVRLLTELLLEAPQIALDAVAELIGVETSRLIDDPEIGPGELWDIIEAWLKVNDLSDFFGRVSKRFPRP